MSPLIKVLFTVSSIPISNLLGSKMFSAGKVKVARRAPNSIKRSLIDLRVPLPEIEELF